MESITVLITSILTTILAAVAISVSVYLGRKSNGITLYEHRVKIHNALEIEFNCFAVLNMIEGITATGENSFSRVVLHESQSKPVVAINILLNLSDNVVLNFHHLRTRRNYINSNIDLYGEKYHSFLVEFVRLFDNFFDQYRNSGLSTGDDSSLIRSAKELGAYCADDENMKTIGNMLKDYQKPLLQKSLLGMITRRRGRGPGKQ